MQLAKDKYGRIGRKVPGIGFDAEIQAPLEAAPRGNVYLSPRSLEIEEARRAEEEQWRIAQAKAKAFENEAKRKAEEVKARLMHEKIMEQKQSVRNRDQELLSAYFKRQSMMGEEARVASTLRAPADFSQEGWNPEIVEGNPEYKGVWGADYRWEKVYNNPLSRDGVFGIGTTDFDKIVKGVDVHQTNIPVGMAPKIVGGTMVGKYDDVEGRMHGRGMNGPMGWDWSWDSITSGISDLGDKTWDQLQDQLPGELSNQIMKELGQITGGSSSGGTATVNVTRPIYQPVVGAANSAAQSLGVPPWAIYAGVGMIGIGLLVVIFKK